MLSNSKPVKKPIKQLKSKETDLKKGPNLREYTDKYQEIEMSGDLSQILNMHAEEITKRVDILKNHKHSFMKKTMSTLVPLGGKGDGSALSNNDIVSGVEMLPNKNSVRESTISDILKKPGLNSIRRGMVESVLNNRKVEDVAVFRIAYFQSCLLCYQDVFSSEDMKLILKIQLKYFEVLAFFYKNILEKLGPDEHGEPHSITQQRERLKNGFKQIIDYRNYLQRGKGLGTFPPFVCKGNEIEVTQKEGAQKENIQKESARKEGAGGDENAPKGKDKQIESSGLFYLSEFAKRIPALIDRVEQILGQNKNSAIKMMALSGLEYGRFSTQKVLFDAGSLTNKEILANHLKAYHNNMNNAKKNIADIPKEFETRMLIRYGEVVLNYIVECNNYGFKAQKQGELIDKAIESLGKISDKPGVVDLQNALQQRKIQYGI